MAKSATAGRVLPHEFVDQMVREVAGPQQTGDGIRPAPSHQYADRARAERQRRMVRVPAARSEEAISAGSAYL